MHVNPEQQGGSCSAPHSCPCTEQLPPVPDVVPVPLRETICGLPLALSLIETVPLSCPVTLGAKDTVIVQFVPDARVEPQLLFCSKLGLAAMLVMLNAAVPELVSVMVSG